MDKEKDGFPITSLREVNMLLKAAGHENIVNVSYYLIFNRAYNIIAIGIHKPNKLGSSN